MNARQFRKRPVVVEAMQYNAANCEAIHKWLGLQHHVYPGEPCGVGVVPVTTIHGIRTFVRPGEYIVAEPEPGRFYPVRADIFADTYEPVDSDAALPPQLPDRARFRATMTALQRASAACYGIDFDSEPVKGIDGVDSVLAARADLTALYQQAAGSETEDGRRLDALEQLVLNDLTDAHVYCRAGDGDEPDAIHIEVDGETISLAPTLRAAIDAARAASQTRPEGDA